MPKPVDINKLGVALNAIEYYNNSGVSRRQAATKYNMTLHSFHHYYRTYNNQLNNTSEDTHDIQDEDMTDEDMTDDDALTDVESLSGDEFNGYDKYVYKELLKRCVYGKEDIRNIPPSEYY